ncbi:hypothetical protein DRN89_02340 [archaeon]|nr:MAG: hypothetical protein DRN89_02340 [archaeon]
MKEAGVILLISNLILFGILCLAAEVAIFLVRAWLGPEIFTVSLFALLALIGIISGKMFPYRGFGFFISAIVFLLCFAPFAMVIYALKPTMRTTFYMINYLVVGALMIIIGRRITS